MWQPLLLCAGTIPALILLAAVSMDRWRRRRRGERTPLSDRLLRPAGYGLQRKLEDLNDSFNLWFMGACFLSFPAFGVFAVTPKDASGRIFFLVLFGLVAAGCTVMAWRRLKQIRDYRRGLVGEQAVAEQLRPLFASGYQIFHDIPCETGKRKWNIDHVAVGPAGVFAIETKYRTKKPGKNGARDHEATFDGNRIEFASGDYDAQAAGQARDNARWLEKELSKATGERVTVQPIVALPGWWVTLKANSDVKVLSGKQVAGFIGTEPVKLSDKAIQRISYQLEQRCRDVEV
ncbi:MAG: nuclease-related domain-containing protein [Verrucomicrobiota bacterium]|jgi:hypothetical protein